MDGKRYKKIKGYLGIYIAFSLVFTAVLFVQANYQRTVEQRRMLTLLAEHPELEGEIAALWDGQNDNYTGKTTDLQITEGITGTYYGEEEKPGQERGAERLELAREIMEDKYGHNVQCIFPQKPFFLFWTAGMLSGAILAVLLGCLEMHGRKKYYGSDETYWKLCDCLEQFQRGNFCQVPDYMDGPEAQIRLWETVREFGNYFDGLRERLKEEEDNTKALITDISHQLKTPLASLRMSHELVTAGDITDEEKREFQEQETKEIEKLEMFLDELVNLSRLEKRVIQIKPVPASLKNTISGAVSQIYMKARNKDIEIQVEMDQDMEICHDRKWTEEAFVNVLDNAVKYSGEHTAVMVHVQPLVSNVLIEISDEGIGIRPEEMVKIYQRFYRGNEAREKVKDGAGVGLYLARMILERQGGTISARRRPGQGSVFKITLPL